MVVYSVIVFIAYKISLASYNFPDFTKELINKTF